MPVDFEIYQQVQIGLGEKVTIASKVGNTGTGLPGGSSSNWTTTDPTVAGNAPFHVGLKIGQTITKETVQIPGKNPVSAYIIINVVETNLLLYPSPTA